MTAAIATDLYSKSIGIINDNLYDFGISIDDKKKKREFHLS